MPYVQVANIHGEGELINMPALAERLMVGEGLLVQWSLKQTSNTGLGLTLLVEEVLDRSDKLRHFCLAQENLEVVHNVAVTLQSCTKLLAKCAPRLVLAVACSYAANTGMLHASLRNSLVACSGVLFPLLGVCLVVLYVIVTHNHRGQHACRMLDLNPWRMLDLLHRNVAGSMLAGRALCTALHSTLSVISSSVSLLPSTTSQISEVQALLAESASSCLSALSSIAVVLPAAVLQLVMRDHLDGMPHDRGCWLLSVLEGVHELEGRIGKYPASLACVQLLTALCAAVGLNEVLVHLSVRVLSGIGCYHSQWHFAPTADCWELSRALLNLLKLALQVGCVAPLKSATKGHRSSLLYSIIQDGLLTRLFWVCLQIRMCPTLPL